jgi:hypothetical protein
MSLPRGSTRAHRLPRLGPPQVLAREGPSVPRLRKSEATPVRCGPCAPSERREWEWSRPPEKFGGRAKSGPSRIGAVGCRHRQFGASVNRASGHTLGGSEGRTEERRVTLGATGPRLAWVALGLGIRSTAVTARPRSLRSR